MKRLLLIPVIILLLAVLVLGGCGQATTTATPSTTQTTGQTTTAALPPLKIGHILDLTGPEALTGQDMIGSFKFAFEAVGNQVNGREIQIIVGDAKGDPSTAVDVARKMVENDKVVAIFGPTQIGEKMAVAGYIKQAGIPLILYNSSPPNIFIDNKWVIGSGGSTLQCPTCMADYIYKHLGYKTIVTLTQDNTAGRSFLNPLTDYFTKAGGTVVQQQWVSVPCPDFSPYLASLKIADALVAWDSAADAIALLTQYHQLGIDKKMPIIAAFHGGFLDSFVIANMAPADAASVIGDLAPMMYAPDSQNAENQEFVKRFTAKIGYPPGADANSGPYQSAMLFMEALKATAGDTTPDILIKALTSVKITGPEGPESFAAGMQIATKNVYILKVDKVPNANAYQYVTIDTYENVPPMGYIGK